MATTRSSINLNLLRMWFFFFILFLFVILSGCAVDIDGSDWYFDPPDRGSFDWDYTAQKTFREEVAVQDHTRITVTAINGEINVEGQDDFDRVVVTASLIVGSSSQADADLHLDDLDIRFTDDGDEIQIETIQPERSYGRGYRAEYDIIIPVGLEVTASQDNGSISVYDLKSSVDVSNVNGDIQIFNLFGNVRAQLVNGSVACEATLPENGEIDLKTVNGEIELDIPTSTSAAFSARVDNVGTISVHDLTFTDASSTPKYFTGTLGNAEGRISLGTANGNIGVFGFELEL